MTRILHHYAQLLRFMAVGSINTLIDISVFGLLIHYWNPGRNGLQAALEAMIAWAVASMIGYSLHSHITYREKLSWTGFYAVTMLGVILQMTCVAVGTATMSHIGAIWGKAVGIGLSSVVTYSGYYWFANHHKSKVWRRGRLRESAVFQGLEK